MTLRSLLSGLISRWEGRFDRVARDEADGRCRGERARGEFISTLIIDHGTGARGAEHQAMSRRLYD